MFLINPNSEIVACILWFFPRFGVKNGGVLSMRMQVILDSSFARLGSAPVWGGKKGEFRDWTMPANEIIWDGPTVFSGAMGMPK